MYSYLVPLYGQPHLPYFDLQCTPYTTPFVAFDSPAASYLTPGTNIFCPLLVMASAALKVSSFSRSYHLFLRPLALVAGNSVTHLSPPVLVCFGRAVWEQTLPQFLLPPSPTPIHSVYRCAPELLGKFGCVLIKIHLILSPTLSPFHSPSSLSVSWDSLRDCYALCLRFVHFPRYLLSPGVGRSEFFPSGTSFFRVIFFLLSTFFIRPNRPWRHLPLFFLSTRSGSQTA